MPEETMLFPSKYFCKACLRDHREGEELYREHQHNIDMLKSIDMYFGTSSYDQAD